MRPDSTTDAVSRKAPSALLEEADRVALGVREVRDRGTFRHIHRSPDALAACALGLLERGLHVRDADVEHGVAVAALGRGADAATDLAGEGEHPVVHLV